MGGVLIRFDTERYVRDFSLRAEDGAILEREVFGSVEWVLADGGFLTEEEALAAMLRRLPERLYEPARALVTAWERWMQPMTGMAALIAALKARGFGIYLLSNATVRQPDYWPLIPGSAEFDGGVVSALCRLLKPEPAIYRLLLERYGLQAEECLFIDDLAVNIAGARRVGMPGIVFRGTEALRRELAERGILCAAEHGEAPRGETPSRA